MLTLSRYVILLTLLTVLLNSLAACNNTPDQQKIADAIDNMIIAVENKNLSALTKYLDKDFVANGNMNIKQVQQLLIIYSRQHQAISATLIKASTTLDPIYTDKAQSTLSVIITGGGRGHLPDDGSIRVIKLDWRKNGAWKIYRAAWD